jgi:hypothetical protein
MLLSAVVVATPAQAAFPGANGKIAFSDYFRIHTINPDGSGNTVIADGQKPAWSADGARLAWNGNGIFVANADGTGVINIGGTGSTDNPSWSPDDSKIAYDSTGSVCSGRFCTPVPQGIYAMNSDGTGDHKLRDNGVDPAWSPDGSKIAFTGDVSQPSGPVTDIFVMNADGTGATNLTQTNNAYESTPAWSPDGAKIVFARASDTGTDPAIYVMNADGSGATQLTNDGSTDIWETYPAWSPDGAKIAFESVRKTQVGPGCPCEAHVLVVMNADGSDPQDVTGAYQPDWQPIPQTYVRPRGASPLLTYLVPASSACAAPNRTHGSPLADGSCAPPDQTSAQLTIGTPDANGLEASTIGSVRYRAVAGNPSTPANEADLKIDVSITDVLRKALLTPYTGELAVDADLRLTDRSNTPNPGGAGPGTVEDASFPVTVPCSVGTCSVATSANAVMAGSVLEGRRAIWQLGQVKVYDGGIDGLASTTVDNTLFMDQGVFVP